MLFGTECDSHTHTHRKPRKFSVGKDPLVDFSTPQEIGTFSVRFVFVHSGVQQMSHLKKNTKETTMMARWRSAENLKNTANHGVCVCFKTMKDNIVGNINLRDL